MDLDERLMREYEILMGIINRLGTSSITIKGWTTTLVVAAISLKKGDLSGELSGILVLAIAGLWFVEIHGLSYPSVSNISHSPDRSGGPICFHNMIEKTQEWEAGLSSCV
jgi:hypothetical protein